MSHTRGRRENRSAWRASEAEGKGAEKKKKPRRSHSSDGGNVAQAWKRGGEGINVFQCTATHKHTNTHTHTEREHTRRKKGSGRRETGGKGRGGGEPRGTEERGTASERRSRGGGGGRGNWERKREIVSERPRKRKVREARREKWGAAGESTKMENNKNRRREGGAVTHSRQHTHKRTHSLAHAHTHVHAPAEAHTLADLQERITRREGEGEKKDARWHS